MDLPVLNLGSSVVVTDPCYIRRGQSTELEITINPGLWEPYISVSDEGAWGSRVSILGITRGGFSNQNGKVVGYAGVDSGQMMIIDSDAVKDWEDNDDEAWPYGTGAEPETTDRWESTLSYFGACKATLGEEQSGVLDELAVVSATGYGDGSYPVYVFEKNGQVERIEVRFMEDEEEEWEDDWYEEEEEVEEEW